MIAIRFANENIQVEKNCCLAALLLQKGYGNQVYAVALNRQFIPAVQYTEVILQENDCVEIIIPMQGG